MQVYVQKSTSTTLPRSACSVSGCELSQVSMFWNSGAGRASAAARSPPGGDAANDIVNAAAQAVSATAKKRAGERKRMAGPFEGRVALLVGVCERADSSTHGPLAARTAYARVSAPRK